MSSAPTIQVVPGPAALATSQLTISSGTVTAGATATITLQAKDAASNLIATGGETVTFSTSGGTSSGLISIVTDNGNGTYTATFTGQTAGTATTLRASIGGLNITSALPTIIVQPGSLSLAQSSITVSSSSILSGGTSLLTLTSRDALGNLILTGGETVLFGSSGGTSTGTIGLTTDNGNGTYSAVFTGQTAGTATSITATVNSNSVTSSSPTITVSSGAVSLAQSVISVSSGTVTAGSVVTVTLTVRDGSGNAITAGGGTVTFNRSGGGSVGSFSAVTDQGNGTYTASFSAQTAGSPTSITATYNGGSITSTSPTIQVFPGLVSAAHSVLSVSHTSLASGNAGTVTLIAKDGFGNALTIGGATISFWASGGTSTLSFGAITDNSNGSYSASYTGVIAGTATTLNATINATAVTTTLPTVLVTPGPAHQLVITNGPISTPAGDCSAAFTATLKDQAGNATTHGSGLNLTISGNGSAAVFTNSVCTAGPPVTISAGGGTTQFYLKGDNVESLTVTATEGTIPLSGVGLSTNIVPSIAWAGADTTPQWEAPGGMSAGGKRDGMMLMLNDIWRDPSGNSYITDSKNNRVVKFDSGGNLVGWIGAVGESPTGGASGCVGLGQNTITPGWCTGGTSKAGGSTGNGGLYNPTGITGDGTSLFVVDNEMNRVNRYDAATGAFTGWIGKVSTTAPTGPVGACTSTTNSGTPGWCTGGSGGVAGNGDAQFDQPKGIFYNSGSIYVTENSNNRVSRFNSATGQFTGWIGKVSAVPTGGDTGCNSATVNSITPGWCLGGTAGAGSSDGAFNNPYGIWGNGTYLYVVDHSHRVQRFMMSDGTFQGWLGQVATTPSGGSGGCNTTTSGLLTPGWCTGGTASYSTSGNGGFYYPEGITGDGVNIYVIDAGNSKINKYTIAGVYGGWIGTINTAPTSPAACATAPLRSSAPTWCMGGTSTKGSMTGGYIFGSVTSNISGAFSDGTYLWVADSLNHRIQKIDIATGAAVGWSGSKVQSPITNWKRSPGYHPMVSRAPESLNSLNLPTSISTTGGLAVSGVYLTIADRANHLVKHFHTNLGSFQGWLGKVVDPPTGGGGSCTSTPSNGTTPTYCTGGTSQTGAGDMQFNNPQSVASDGIYTYVADTFNNRIQRINLSTGSFGGWIGKVASTPSSGPGCSTTSIGNATPGWCYGGAAGAGTGDGHLYQPRGVAVAGGMLFVVDDNHRISKFSASSGAFLGWLGKISSSPTGGDVGCNGAPAGSTTPGWCTGGTSTNGTGDGQLAYPNSIASNGTVIVVGDYSNGRLSQYDFTTGAFIGWMGKILTVPTGGPAGCTSASVGTLTPGWCTGGTSITSSAPEGALSGIGGVTLQSGFVYVTDSQPFQSRIFKYSLTGGYQGWKGLIGMNTGMSGGIGCSSAAMGSFTPSWCTGGASIPGSGWAFDMPTGLSSDSNYLYVLDSGNARVMRVPLD